MPKGIIRRLVADDSSGFIKTGWGGDFFFHRSHLQKVDYNSLREGQQVEFEVGWGRNGHPEAVRVGTT